MLENSFLCDIDAYAAETTVEMFLYKTVIITCFVIFS